MGRPFALDRRRLGARAWLLGAVVCVGCAFDLEPLHTETLPSAGTAGLGGASSASSGSSQGGQMTPAPTAGTGAGGQGQGEGGQADGGQSGGGSAGEGGGGQSAGGAAAREPVVRYTFPQSAAMFGVFPEESHGDVGLQLQAGDPNALEPVSPHGVLLMEPSTALVTIDPIVPKLGACQKAGELSLEVWARPETPNPGALLRVSNRDAAGDVSFSLEQGTGNVGIFASIRTSADPTGAPLRLPVDIAGMQDHHLVFVHEALGKETLYVDGVVATTAERAGDFSNWSQEHRLTIGGEPNGGALTDKWFGRVYEVAIYCFALSSQSVAEQYAAGF